MVYITAMQTPSYHQMTLEELLFGTFSGSSMITDNVANTKTYVRENVSFRYYSQIQIDRLIHVLSEFNRSVEPLRGVERSELYTTFRIPKKSGGLRRIDAPNPELMDALRRLKTIFETEFNALYHTSAFAYIKKRSTVDCVRRHQSNESRWFGKYDLHDFFGSTTLEFVMAQLSMIFPFSEVVKDPGGREELEKALELGFLNGGLPQGTPLSPLITNVMMIPIDYALYNKFRDFNKQRFVYTRYADDFIISSQYNFDFRLVQQEIVDTLASFNAPFTVNQKKTRYGSSSGGNWNLGVMLNKDNEITVGFKRKRQFQSMLRNFVRDTTSGNHWDKEEVQYLAGLHSYYRMVEPKNIDGIVSHLSQLMGADILGLMKAELA